MVSSYSILGEPIKILPGSGMAAFPPRGEMTYPPDCVPLGDMNCYLGEFETILYPVGDLGDILIYL
jgi:hypothetical protein